MLSYFIIYILCVSGETKNRYRTCLTKFYEYFVNGKDKVFFFPPSSARAISIRMWKFSYLFLFECCSPVIAIEMIVSEVLFKLFRDNFWFKIAWNFRYCNGNYV